MTNWANEWMQVTAQERFSGLSKVPGVLCQATQNTERQRRLQEALRCALELASSGSNGHKSAVTLLSRKSHPLRAWARHGGPCWELCRRQSGTYPFIYFSMLQLHEAGTDSSYVTLLIRECDSPSSFGVFQLRVSIDPSIAHASVQPVHYHGELHYIWKEQRGHLRPGNIIWLTKGFIKRSSSIHHYSNYYNETSYYNQLSAVFVFVYCD